MKTGTKLFVNRRTNQDTNELKNTNRGWPPPHINRVRVHLQNRRLLQFRPSCMFKKAHGPKTFHVCIIASIRVTRWVLIVGGGGGEFRAGYSGNGLVPHRSKLPFTCVVSVTGGHCARPSASRRLNGTSSPRKCCISGK